MNNNDIDTVFIATMHNTHAKYIIEGLKANKNIFVEKPLAITQDELEAKKQKLKSIESNIDQQIKDIEKLLGE